MPISPPRRIDSLPLGGLSTKVFRHGRNKTSRVDDSGVVVGRRCDVWEGGYDYTSGYLRLLGWQATVKKICSTEHGRIDDSE